MVLNDERNSVSSNDATYNMIRILCKQKSGINICHINAQSLNNKIDEYRYIFESSCVDVICVSETWFDENIPDSILELSGFKMYRSDRRTHGGGVAIFIKKGITSNFVLKSLPNEKIEYIFAEVSSMGKKLLIGCIYRPNKRIGIVDLHQNLENITVNYENVVLCGDFNSNVLCESQLLDAMESIGLFSPNKQTPTHFTTTSQSLLDLFFVNDIDKILLYDQICAPCFSKHDLIFLCFDFRTMYSNEKTTYYDFKRMDYNTMVNELGIVHWDHIYFMPDVNDQVNFLEKNLTEIFEKSVPVKTVQQNSTTKPWFNEEIRTKINQRDYAYKCWKRFKTDDLHEKFSKARKEVNKLIKQTKFSYFSNLFSTAVDSKKKWNIIRNIGIGKSSSVNSMEINVDLLNAKFIGIPNVSISPNYYSCNTSLIYSSHSSRPKFSFRCVSQDDTFMACHNVKSSAIGPDKIHPTFLKLVLPSLLPHITHIFNTIITKSIFPQNWKYAKIVPIPKNSNEYRPIAILSYLSKVFERLLHKQMVEYIQANKLFSDVQSGFRPKHSCATALIEVTEEIRSYIDSGNIALLVLLDHSKAFDMVNHTMLNFKLAKQFNFASSAADLVSSYLNNRYQYVSSNNKHSLPLPVIKGVPQGSILGPLLFTIYINDLPKQLSHCKIHMYADDVQIYICSEPDKTDDCIVKLNSDLSKIEAWAAANGLCLNPAKSKCLLISRNTTLTTTELNIILNSQRIEIVKKVKNLGIIFNSSLTWSDHINTAAGRVFSMLRSLWATQHSTPINTRMLLAKSYLIPALLYGSEVFASCDQKSTRKLTSTYNAILRYVFNLGRFCHITPYETKLYGVRFCDLLNIRSLVLLHKIIYTGVPSYLFERLSFTQSRRNKNLVQIRFTKLISEWQFFVHTIRLWNSIPSSLQFVSNTTQFRKCIINFYCHP